MFPNSQFNFPLFFFFFREISSTTKAETYRGGDNRSSASGSPNDGLGTKVEKSEGDSPPETGRTSEELEKMGEMVEVRLGTFALLGRLFFLTLWTDMSFLSTKNF